jgi:hypothetical protein
MSTPVYFFAAVVMLANAYHSDTTQERVWHVVVPGCVGVASWILLACACTLRSFPFELTACFFATACTWSLISPILAWLMGGLRGATSSAVGAAFVVALGNIIYGEQKNNKKRKRRKEKEEKKKKKKLKSDWRYILEG